MRKWLGSRLHKLLLWFYARLGLWAAAHIAAPWSRLYRRLFERSYTKMPSNLPWSEEKLLQFFQTCTWTADKWYMGWDVMSKPERLYETRRSDCDEYALFAAKALEGRRTRWILEVLWYDPQARGLRKFYGHRVCLYLDKNWKWCHIGNWGKYGPYKTLGALVSDIPPSDCIPCAWGLRFPEAYPQSGIKELDFFCGGYFDETGSPLFEDIPFYIGKSKSKYHVRLGFQAGEKDSKHV